MAAADHTLHLRGAILLALKADATISGLTAGQIYAEQPTLDPSPWRWIRYGVPITAADESTGMIGSDVDLTLHVFTDDSTTAYRLCRLLARLLDDNRLPLPAEEDDRPGRQPYVVSLTWDGGTEVRADSARKGGYHGLVRLNAITAEAT